MTLDIGLLKTAGALASHAARRQGLIAENMANADTPGYKARDLQPFDEVVTGAASRAKSMRATRPEHFGTQEGSLDFAIREVTGFGAESPNGNTVSLDDQMMRSAALSVDHDLALGVYAKSLQILRHSLGRR